MDSVHLSASVFASGALITGHFECITGCTADDLLFYDSEGMLLDGMIVDVSASRPDLNFAWQSSTPLAPGSYTVLMPPSYTPAAFTVVEATSELPALTPSLQTQKSAAGDPVTCIENSEEATVVVFYESVLNEAVLRLSPEGINATQYSYSVEVEMGARAGFNGGSYSINLGDESREVCFEGFAMPLLGGDEVSLGTDCVQTSEVAGLGLSEEIVGNLNAVLNRCLEPPTDYEDEWCALFAQASMDHSCEAFAYKDACVAARYACPDGDLPEFEHTLVEEEDGDSGNGDGGDGGGTWKNRRVSDESGGCTLGAGKPSHTGFVWFGFLLTCLGLTRRRESLARRRESLSLVRK